MVQAKVRVKRAKAKAAKKSKKAAAKKAKGLVGRTTNVGICKSWIVAFGKKQLTTKAAVTKFMKTEFPGRDSKVFNFPNVVVTRCNKGMLDGKKHNFKKYPGVKKEK